MQQVMELPNKRDTETVPIVDETMARRAANGYLGRDVGIPFSAIDGIYIPIEQPVWQFSIRFRLPKLGTLGLMGTIDVDAVTGEPLPLIEEQIHNIQDRADAIVEFRTQAAAA